MKDVKKIGKFLQQNKEEYKRKGLELHDDHPAPRTRRELLSCGFYGLASSLIMPSLGSLLYSTKALAEGTTCSLEPNTSGVPLVQVHFSGGRRLWGDGLALGLGQNGDPAEYSPGGGPGKNTDFFSFGLAPENHPSSLPYVDFLGHAVSPISYIYQSAITRFGGKDSAKFKELERRGSILSLCARTPDDSRGTSQNILPSAVALRGKGDFQLAANGEGTDLSGLSNVPMFSLTERASVINGGDISSLVETGLSDVDVNMREGFMKMLLKQVSNRVGTKEARAILNCSSQGAIKKIKDYSGELDPFTLDPQIGTVFDPNDGGNVSIATISYMLANNIALVGGLNFGGYDYHNGTSSGYTKDYDVFQQRIWPVVDYFLTIGKPLMLFLTSDGATYSNNAVDPRLIMLDGVETEAQLCSSTGDRGRNGGAMFLFIAGKDQEKVPLDFHQIGRGMPGGSVARDGNPIGYDEGNYHSVATEVMRRAMIHMSGGASLAGDFAAATGGKRFSAALESFIPIKI